MAFPGNKKHKFLEALKGDRKIGSAQPAPMQRPMASNMPPIMPAQAPRPQMPIKPPMQAPIMPTSPHVAMPKNIQPLPQMPQFDKLKKYFKKPGGI